MKTTNKKTARTRMRSGARGATQRDARSSCKAAADAQVAEIERTFTRRYEW
jgi:hypothetical protein